MKLTQSQRNAALAIAGAGSNDKDIQAALRTKITGHLPPQVTAADIRTILARFDTSADELERMVERASRMIALGWHLAPDGTFHNRTDFGQPITFTGLFATDAMAHQLDGVHRQLRPGACNDQP